MSSANVELVRRGWDAWLAGDLDALFAYFHPDIEWHTTTFEGWPEVAVYKGRAEITEFLDTWQSNWTGFESGLERIVDAGDDTVVALPRSNRSDCPPHSLGADADLPGSVRRSHRPRPG